MRIHELKLLLQGHLTDGLITIVGSGLSCAEGLPGMGDLARHLRTSVEPDLPDGDKAQWRSLLAQIDILGLEAALLRHAPTPAITTAMTARTAELFVTHERDAISQVFATTRTLRFTRLLTHLLKPPDGITVITTNYDRLLEIAAEEANLGVDTLFVGHFAGHLNERESRLSFCRDVTLRGKHIQYRFRPRVTVLKPHGSLNWYHRSGRPVSYAGDLPLPRLIITPGSGKFRSGYESPFDRHRERANSAIDKAGRFLILGYGFNDDHLETHLTPRIKSGVPTLLLTRTLSDNALALARNYANVTAVQHGSDAGREGCSIYVNKAEQFYPDFPIWDLGSFVSEVLEP